MKASLGSIEVAVGMVALAGLAFVLYKATGKVAGAAASVGNAINPLNHDNVFASAVNKAGAAVSGDANWSLGGWVYDLTHADAGAIATAPTPTATAWGSNYDEGARLLKRYPAPPEPAADHFDALGNYIGNW